MDNMISIHKGLRNGIGENNCFLNAAIQTLWHLDSFRVLLQMSEEHSFSSNSLFIRLKTMFAHFEFGDEASLPPDEVRAVLSSKYSDQQRFQKGEMEDAGETLEAILQLIHCEEVRAESRELGEDTECEPPCLSHSVFCCRLVDQYSCLACRSTSNPEPSSDFVYRVYVQDLLEKARKKMQIGPALQSMLMSGAERGCPDDENGKKCRGSARVSRWCLNLPLVFSLNLVWPSNRVSKSDIRAVLSTITYDLDLLDFLNVSSSNGQYQEEECTLYHFRGMICYSSLHYFSYFFSIRRKRWLLFDDSRVREVGTWAEVVRQCEKGSVQPTTLLYERSEVKLNYLKGILRKQEQARVLKLSLGEETILVEKPSDDNGTLIDTTETSKEKDATVVVYDDAPKPTAPSEISESCYKSLGERETSHQVLQRLGSAAPSSNRDSAKISTAKLNKSQSTNPCDPGVCESSNPLEDLSDGWDVVEHDDSCKDHLCSQKTSSDYVDNKPPLPDSKDASCQPHTTNPFVSTKPEVQEYCNVLKEIMEDEKRMSRKPDKQASSVLSTNPFAPPAGTSGTPIQQQLPASQGDMQGHSQLASSPFAKPPLPTPSPNVQASSMHRSIPQLRYTVTFQGQFQMGGLGMEMRDAVGGLVVVGFNRNRSGKQQVAERCGLIHLMDKVLEVDGRSVEGMTMEQFKQELQGKFSQPCVRLKLVSSSVKAFTWECSLCKEFNILEDLLPMTGNIPCRRCLAPCNKQEVLAEIDRYTTVYPC